MRRAAKPPGRLSLGVVNGHAGELTESRVGELGSIVPAPAFSESTKAPHMQGVPYPLSLSDPLLIRCVNEMVIQSLMS